MCFKVLTLYTVVQQHFNFPGFQTRSTHDALLGWDPWARGGSLQSKFLWITSARVPFSRDAGPSTAPALSPAPTTHHDAGHPLGALQSDYSHCAAVPACTSSTGAPDSSPGPGSGAQLGVLWRWQQVGRRWCQPAPASSHTSCSTRRSAPCGLQRPPAALPALSQWPWKWLLQVNLFFICSEVLLSQIFLCQRFICNSPIWFCWSSVAYLVIILFIILCQFTIQSTFIYSSVFLPIIRGKGEPVIELSWPSCRQLLYQSVATVLAHAGFELAQESVLETLTDVVHEHYLHITHLLRVAVDREARLGASPFPDVVEQVFHEVGIGSVLALQRFWQVRIKDYHNYMLQVNLAWQNCIDVSFSPLLLHFF